MSALLCSWLLLHPHLQPESLAFDQLVLTSGTTVEGLVLEETPQQIRFQFMLRRPGVRTLVFETVYERGEVSKVIKAPQPGRDLARQWLSALVSSKKLETDKLESLKLSSAPWITGEGNAHRYQGPYFELLSPAPLPLVRLVAVRLEAMFGGYIGTLGQRVQPVRPVTIFMFPSMVEYKKYLQLKGIPLLNPAIYDARGPHILIGCELPAQQEQYDQLRSKHAEQLKELLDQRKKIALHYGGRIPDLLRKQMQQLQQQLLATDADNESTLARLQASFFALLYHESFHAYLDQRVFPSEQYQVPRWLNEGLAQLFETALVEIGELRVGQIEEKRLSTVQDAVRKGRFMTIRELLQSPAQQFLVRHTTDSFEADRFYQASWALAHFLTFELKVLSKPALASYVAAKPGGDPIKAFEQLTGLTLADAEERYKQYLLRLRPDGTLR
ncbi:MAG: DUF1570 domain-containing protein [Gemmatales bacterium]